MNIKLVEGYTRIYSIDKFVEEYAALFGKNVSLHKTHLKKLRESLSFLESEPNAVRLLPKRFEQLKNTDLLCIRDVSKSNPRVLFAYIDDSGAIILLHCFKEKRSSDYQAAIRIAESRLKEVQSYV